MKFSRRALLAATAGMAAFRKTTMTQAPLASADPSKVPGRPPSVLGQRSPFEEPQRLPAGTIVSRAPLQDLSGTITPADLHFERHHAGVPLVDPHSYSLLIHGMVARPTLFTVADLRRFPSVSRRCPRWPCRRETVSSWIPAADPNRASKRRAPRPGQS